MSEKKLDKLIEQNIAGAIDIYCGQITMGVKLVAEYGFENKYLSVVQETIDGYSKCKAFYNNIDRKEYGRTTVYIYKYAFVKELIKKIDIEKKTKTDNKPSLADIYIEGKLFGIPDYDIGVYLKDNGYTKTLF